jgi:hypothetical protein
LIYERIREERRRGAALRMAIRNGFDRATTTIVDANVTTLITAIVLYAIGTDQIRGFAVILILGILMSMFTAIFCSRVVFEILERTRRLKELRMRSIFPDTHVDFMGKRKLAMVASIVLIVIGMVGMVARGKQIFDIDFLGGTSVTMILEQPTTEAEIRRTLDPRFAALTIEGSSVQYSVNRVDVEGLTPMTIWKIDSSIPEVDDLEKILEDSFPLAMYSMEFDNLTETREEMPEAPAPKEGPGTQGRRPGTQGRRPGTQGRSPEGRSPGAEGRRPGPRKKPRRRRKKPRHRRKKPRHRRKKPRHRRKMPRRRRKKPRHRRKMPRHRRKMPRHRRKTPRHRRKMPRHRRKKPRHRRKKLPSRRKKPRRRRKKPGIERTAADPDPAADESLHFDRSPRSMFVSLDSTQWLLAMADPESETTAEPAAEQSESTEAPMADESPSLRILVPSRSRLRRNRPPTRRLRTIRRNSRSRHRSEW